MFYYWRAACSPIVAGLRWDFWLRMTSRLFLWLGGSETGLWWTLPPIYALEWTMTLMCWIRGICWPCDRVLYRLWVACWWVGIGLGSLVLLLAGCVFTDCNEIAMRFWIVRGLQDCMSTEGISKTNFGLIIEMGWEVVYRVSCICGIRWKCCPSDRMVYHPWVVRWRVGVGLVDMSRSLVLLLAGCHVHRLHWDCNVILDCTRITGLH